MTLVPILADVDFGQVIVVIVFLVVGFINWLINLWKQKQETAERARHEPTQEQPDTHRRDWSEHTKRIETQPDRHPEPSPSPAPSAGGGSLKDLFEELKRAAQEANSPPPLAPTPSHPASRPTPPPMPAPARVHPPHPASLPLAPPPHPTLRTTGDATLQTHAASATLASHAYDTKTKTERRKGALPFTAMLHTSVGYQQAFILKEILDTPKGIRNTPWDNDPY